ATPKGLFQVRNILAKLGKKHGKTTLEPACREALNKKLVPTMTVLQRLQTTIAHEMKNGHTPHRSGCDVARTPQSTPVDITQFSANDVFIRPIEHYADDGDTGLVNDVFPYGTHTSQE
ncbi:IS21 family transposase, partial [Corynebacterium pyruviciproducens]